MNTKPLKQSTLVLLIGIFIFLAVLYPTMVDILRPTMLSEQTLTLENGQEIVCIVNNGYQEGGLSCSVNGFKD